MLRTLIVAAAVFVAAPTAFAQTESENQQDAPPPPPEVRMAIPRSEAPPRPAPAPRAERPAGERPRSEPARPAPAPAPARAEQPAAPSPADADQRRAVPRGSRPRGDNPEIGTAVPREQGRRPAPPVARGGDNRDRDIYRNGGRTIYAGPPVYNNYYYYPRRYYPYGYGAFGLGYFYYDPYTWYPGAYSNYGGYGYGAPGYYPGRPVSVFDVGELRLRVSPRHAQVFVDGYYAGEVDDYDGILQAMKLESGPYHIELVAPGYETLEFDVRINPGQKINYKGELKKQLP